jgi:hypothetical protein
MSKCLSGPKLYLFVNSDTDLKPFRISPRTVRLADRTAKGYTAESMVDAWERYRPRVGPEGGIPNETSSQHAYLLHETHISTGNTIVVVTGAPPEVLALVRRLLGPGLALAGYRFIFVSFWFGVLLVSDLLFV